MTNITVEDWKEIPAATIKKLIKEGQQELERRKDEESERLVAEFHKVWSALQNAGITITYGYKYEGDTIWLDDWDEFGFR